MSKKVIIGLSGGVDSAISAYLMQRQGYDVHGVFMHNWHDDENHCTSAEDKQQVHLVGDHLNIPTEVIDFSDAYQERVFEHMLTSLQQGYTPNPDVLCNQEIKFQALLEYALSQQADALITGHYATVVAENDYHYLEQGVDPNKDQSYFLCRIPKNALSKIYFPLGKLRKPEVRKLAEKINLPNAQRKDSTGICFIGNRKFDDFIRQYLLDKPGAIQDTSGKTIGQHNGLFYHTIGQRKGLKIGGGFGDLDSPWYVVAKDITSQTITVAQGKDHPALFKKQLNAVDMHWLYPAPGKHFTAQAKIRHRQPDQVCTVAVADHDTNRLEVTFDQPQRAITPGQYIVLYQNQRCLGGALITE